MWARACRAYRKPPFSCLSTDALLRTRRAAAGASATAATATAAAACFVVGDTAASLAASSSPIAAASPTATSAADAAATAGAITSGIVAAAATDACCRHHFSRNAIPHATGAAAAGMFVAAASSAAAVSPIASPPPLLPPPPPSLSSVPLFQRRPLASVAAEGLTLLAVGAWKQWSLVSRSMSANVDAQSIWYEPGCAGATRGAAEEVGSVSCATVLRMNEVGEIVAPRWPSYGYLQSGMLQWSWLGNTHGSRRSVGCDEKGVRMGHRGLCHSLIF